MSMQISWRSSTSKPRCRESGYCWRRRMSEEKRKRVRRARDRAERELEANPHVRLLKERIAYHTTKLEQERSASENG